MKLRALFLRARRDKVNFFVNALTCIIFLLLIPCVFVSAQKITISKTNVPLQSVFTEIEKQSSYQFFYNESLLQKAGMISINVKNASIDETLKDCFKDQPLTYSMVDNTIIVKRKEEAVANNTPVASLPVRITVNGKVTNSNGEPVAGAYINVKGTSITTATDEKGFFTLPDVDENAVLVVSSIAHNEQEIRINKRTSLFISLLEKVGQLDETIVVAYNTTTRRNNVAALTTIKGEAIQNLPSRSFDRDLQGLVPGLLVTNGTGQPGGGVSNFVLRGISTSAPISNGSTVRNPLIVIDGVPVSQENFQLYINVAPTPVSNPLSQLNPSDFESITVLKDAAAIALYGARASNGVIVITTKKGKAGKTVFGFRQQTDIASRLKGKIKLVNQDEYLQLLFEAYRNSNPALYATDAAILYDLHTKPSNSLPKFPSIINAPGDTSFYPQSDWIGALYTPHAATLSNEISMSGGNEKTTFYLNLEYTRQHGVVKETGYDRKSLRFNFENRPVSWLKLGLNSTFSYNVQNYGASLYNNSGIGLTSLISPLDPIKLIDGSYMMNYDWGMKSGVTTPNPVAAAQYNRNRNTAFRSLNKMYGEFSFLKHFKFTTNVGVDFMLGEAKEKADPRLYDAGNTATPGSATAGRIEEQDIRRANLIVTNILRFDKVWNKDHSLNVIFGHEAQSLNQKRLSVGVRGLSLPYYDQITSPGVTVFRQSGYKTEERLLSFFAQANYGFKEKYFLTASARKDGSSKFGDEKRYGTFWSSGLGWVITEEPFMKGSASWLDYLKIRSSIGATGNAGPINASTRYDRLSNTTFLGGVAVYPTSAPGNPDIQWEQAFNWDAGLEARFFKERINITADIYTRKTSNMIYSINLPANSGYTFMQANIGDMKNSGTEFSISADIIRNRDFHWNLNTNWSTNKNILVKANVSTAAITSSYLYTQEGKNFQSFYMAKWAGVNPATGAPQWYDSTGKPNSIYSAAKPEFVGKPQPDGFGAITNTISYKGLELSDMLYYQYGFKIYNNDMLVNDGQYPYLNQDKRALDRWQKPGDIATNPIRILNNTQAGSVSTRFLYKGDYIRLQNVAIGYSFPKRIIDRLHLSMLKVFIQAHNLALWTKFPGQDPDNTNASGNVENTYPNQRSFSFGLNLNF